MTLLTSALVVLATFAVIAWLVIRPERLTRKHTLVARQRRLVTRQLPWWQKLDERRRQRLMDQILRLQHDITLVPGDGMTLDETKRFAVLGHIAVASLAPDVDPRWLPDEILIYDGPAVGQDAWLPHDMIEDLGELATGDSWAAQRLTVSWPSVVHAAEGGADNPLIRSLAVWRMQHRMAEADRHARWLAAYEAAFERWMRDPRPGPRDVLRHLDDPTDLPHFIGAAAEAFFQRGPTLARALPGLYDLMATGFDFDTARRAPAGHHTPRAMPG